MATDAPVTYISDTASKILGMVKPIWGSSVEIGGRRHVVCAAPNNSRFSDINILGADFCQLHRVYAALDYEKRRAKLLFGGEWETEEIDAVGSVLVGELCPRISFALGVM
ncbi:hypothetical protein RUND412_004882 [Rhizina undulata]